MWLKALFGSVDYAHGAAAALAFEQRMIDMERRLEALAAQVEVVQRIELRDLSNRDVERDATRDIERDVSRDTLRDIERDLRKDDQ